MSPELSALLATRPFWSVETAAEAVFGYKDNLLLSSVADERSAFVRGGAEVMLMGLRPRTQLSFFAQGERTEYFEGEGVKHDANAFALAEVAYQATDTLKLRLPVIGSYADDVFDVSETEFERTVAELEVSTARVAPTLRWSYARRGWIEAQGVAERKWYADEGNDARNGEGRLRAGWRLGRRFEVQLGAARRWRNFEHRVQYTATGRARPGTQLKVAEREGEVRLVADWDGEGVWETTTRLQVMDYRDNYSGFFSYERGRVAQEVAWRRAPWLVRLEASAERTEWHVQTVGIGVAPPARHREGFEASLRMERAIGERWTAVAGYSWERARSNETIASYRVNEGVLGLRWTWEK